MRKLLTAKQLAVFNFIRQKIYDSYPPTLREIADHFGFSEKAACDHRRSIRKKGYLDWQPGKPRTLTLLPPYNDDTQHFHLVENDMPELGFQKGDHLLIDTRQPVAEDDVILSTRGEIKRFRTGDTAFGKVVSFVREVNSGNFL